jgi:hypothetical protein
MTVIPLHTKRYFDEYGHFIIRPYRQKDIAWVYGVSTRTIRRWMKKLTPMIGNKNAKYYTIEEVTTIVQAIGIPSTLVPLQKAA